MKNKRTIGLLSRLSICLLFCANLPSALAGNVKVPEQNKVSVVISKDNSAVFINGDSGMYVNVLSQPKQRIIEFNDDLKRRGSDDIIARCSLVLSMPVGGSDGDVYYGGLCTLSDTQKTVAVCDDDMVGNFRMVPVKRRSFSKRQLIKFTIINCTGG